MDLNEKTIEEEYLYKGKILNLKRDKVLLPNGKQAIREMVEHSGGSAVYCEKDGKILFVKQFRYPYKKVIYEIPAGKLNKGEDPLSAAKRELNEECGVLAENFVFMNKVYPSVGYTDEIIYIYKAEGIKTDIQALDEDEFLSVEWIDKEKVLLMIKNGDICDAKTLVAILSAK